MAKAAASAKEKKGAKRSDPEKIAPAAPAEQPPDTSWVAQIKAKRRK